MTREEDDDYENEIEDIYKGKTLRELINVLPQTKSEYEYDHEVVKAYNDGQACILDKIRAEILDTLYVDSLIFGELIDFKNGKISADDVIEEFNRVTRMEVLRIIDKYKAGDTDGNS